VGAMPTLFLYLREQRMVDGEWIARRQTAQPWHNECAEHDGFVVLADDSVLALLPRYSLVSIASFVSVLSSFFALVVSCMFTLFISVAASTIQFRSSCISQEHFLVL